MKTEVKKLEKCKVQLKVTLDAAECAAAVKEVEKAFVREARLPGFRPGKAPIEIIRKEFAAQLKTETERTVFQKNYPAAVAAEKLEEVALTNVRDITYGAEGGGFTAEIDVKPVFKLPTYKGLKISTKEVAVKDEDVSAAVEQMRAMYATYEDAKDGEVIGKGDFVQIDYKGTVDGKPVLEVAPEAKFVAGADGYWTQVEEGRFLPEILEALEGMKIGESKTGIKAKFDKEAAPEGLKGKTAVYDLTVKAFRRRLLPTDAEYAEKAKEESFEKLVARAREQLEKRAIEMEANRRENEAVELLLKKADFEVPGTLVQRQLERSLQELAQRAQYSGLGADYFEKNRDKIMKDAEENAERQVRLWYLIDAIAEAEKLEAKDEEKGKKVIELILANAKK